MDTRTITLPNSFDKPTQFTKEAYVNRWLQHAGQLKRIGIDIQERVRVAAEAEFEAVYQIQEAP